MTTEKRNFKGIWIPAALWLCDELSINEKVLLLEIDSLQDPVKGCYKSNKAFGQFFGLSANRISELVNSLQKKGFLKIKQLTKGKQVIQRQLFLTSKLHELSAADPIRETEGGYSETRSPYSENRRGYSENTEERGNSLGVTREGESAHANTPDLNPANPPAQQPTKQGPAQPDQPQPMHNDWEPVIDQLAASLRCCMIPEPVAHALANDQELIGQFKIHHSVSYGREHTRTGWTAQLAKWLARDWQKMGRPQTAPEYAAQRGLDPTLSGCPTQELHALWSAKLGDIKPVPTLSEWQRSKSAVNLAQRWHEGFTTPLNSDPNQMRYHDQETGLSWWGGLFDAIRNSPALSKDNWINLQRLGSLDTLAQVVGQVLLEAQGGRP